MSSLHGAKKFGQQVDLTQRIRDILRDYPEGTAILKELLQNADDAGASQFALVLDARTRFIDSERPKLFPEREEGAMASLQGPSLLAFNSATFGEDDFEAIQVRRI